MRPSGHPARLFVAVVGSSACRPRQPHICADGHTPWFTDDHSHHPESRSAVPEPSDANTGQPDNKSAHSDTGLSLSIAPHYFSLAELDERPFIIRDIPPNPPELKDFPQGGKLVLRLWIDTEGRVVNAEPVSSELPPAFTDSARSGFQDARFAPGRKHGQAVASVLNVTIHYAPQQ